MAAIKKAKSKNTTNWVNVGWLILVQWVIALQWLMSGWGKFTSTEFMDGFVKTVTVFAAKTPFGFYADFLKGTVLPNAELFANLVRTGELLVGVALAAFGIYYLTQKKLDYAYRLLLVVALFAGVLLNLNFYLAAGWSSPSTAGINVLMGLIQVILGVYYAKGLKK